MTTPVDPVIAAIQQAVAADPDSIHLRAHLVELHLRSAASASAPDDEHVLEARRQLGELLVRAPDHPTVVDLLASSGPLVDPTAWRAPTDGQVPASGTQRGLSAAGGPGPGDGDGMPLDSLEARPGQGSGGDPTDWSRPDITLIDVAGMHDVKERLEVAVFGPARRPELAAAFGRLGRGGLMLWGPPGCGKTFLARAVAGHLGVSFGSVGIEAVLDRWLGSSERNLAALFRAAREDQPCVLFLDEVDAIGQRRSRLRSEHLRTVMSQLLVELDGVDRDNTGVFVIAATNLPWDVDPALRRPGRFDRTVFVPPPDATARAQILVDRLADVPLGEVDVPAIVARTEAFSGADMAHVGDTAAELALAASIASDDVVPVDQAHLREAVDQVAPSIADWIASARNAATWSDDDALFAPFTDWLAGWDKRR